MSFAEISDPSSVGFWDIVWKTDKHRWK